MKGFGRVLRRKGGTYAIAYFADGVEIRESVARLLGKPPQAVTERDAERALERRYKERARGSWISPITERATLADQVDLYVKDLGLRGKRSATTARRHLRQVVQILGARRLVQITSGTLMHTAADWQAAGVAPGTIATRLGWLKAVLKMARRERKVAEVPEFPRLELHNARQGFAEAGQVLAIMARLDRYDADVVLFGHTIGRRISETLSYQWPHVDRGSRELHVPGSITKNGEADVVPLVGEVWEMIERRWRSRVLGSPWVFHRGGTTIGYGRFRRRWRAAATAAGCPGLLYHDLRRSAYRDMLEAGVDPFTAMDIVGHRTMAMAKRYAIRNTRSMAAALERTQAARATRTKHGQMGALAFGPAG